MLSISLEWSALLCQLVIIILQPTAAIITAGEILYADLLKASTRQVQHTCVERVSTFWGSMFCSKFHFRTHITSRVAILFRILDSDRGWTAWKHNFTQKHKCVKSWSGTFVDRSMFKLCNMWYLTTKEELLDFVYPLILTQISILLKALVLHGQISK